VADSPIADRMQRIDASGIRKVFDLAAKLENPVNLSIGQPDFDVPEPCKERAVQAIRDGANRYTVTQGDAALREALADRLRAEFGRFDGPVLVTSGVSGGLLLAFLATVNPGDEVLVPDPYFVMYKHLVGLLGGMPVFVDTYPDFRLRREALEAAVTERTRMLLLNSPANPTGIVYAEEELRTAVDVARRHNLLIVSDEIYNEFTYDGPAPSPWPMYDRVLLLRGFSKTFAMTGWRWRPTRRHRSRRSASVATSSTRGSRDGSTSSGRAGRSTSSRRRRAGPALGWSSGRSRQGCSSFQAASSASATRTSASPTPPTAWRPRRSARRAV